MHQVSRRFCQALILTCLLVQFANVPVTIASDDWVRASAPVSMSMLYAGDQEVQTYIAPPQPSYLRAQTAAINVLYDGFPPAARVAFEHAVGIWESILVAPIQINIYAAWAPLETGALGGALPNPDKIYV